MTVTTCTLHAVETNAQPINTQYSSFRLRRRSRHARRVSLQQVLQQLSHLRHQAPLSFNDHAHICQDNINI